ncbi:MAG: hypothetical protein RLZZ347_820 [Candidatus Parcubacteria bacterium]|jgi:hypothetical protein
MAIVVDHRGGDRDTLSPQQAFSARRQLEGKQFEAEFWGLPPPTDPNDIPDGYVPYQTFMEALRLIEASQVTIPGWNPYGPKIGLAAKLFPLVARKVSVPNLMLLNANYAPNPMDYWHHGDGIFYVRRPEAYVIFDLTISNTSLASKNSKTSPAEVLIHPWSLHDNHIERCAEYIAQKLRARVNHRRIQKLARKKRWGGPVTREEYDDGE